MLNSKLNQIQIMNNSENEEEEENDPKIQEKNSFKLSEINVQKKPDNMKNNIFLDSYTCLIKRRKKSIQFSDDDDDYRRQFRENDHFNKPQGIYENFILSF